MRYREPLRTNPNDFPVLTPASRRELFFAVQELIEREGENLMVHGVAVFEVVGQRIGGAPEIDARLREACAWEGWEVALVSTDVEARNPTWIVVTDVAKAAAAHQQRNAMNGTRRNSYVLMDMRDGVWEELPHAVKRDVLDLEPTHRERRRFEHAVSCCR